MKNMRLLALGGASLSALIVGAWCWRAATSFPVVIITVPDADGLFGVWCRDSHTDVVDVQGRTSTFSIPQDGLLRAASMACLNTWHTELHVDRRGQRVENVHCVGTTVSSEWEGSVTLWYRGTATSPWSSSEAQGAWLIQKGIVR